MSVTEASARAVELLLAQIKGTLERYGVHYDQFFSERVLHEGSPSYLDRALALVAEAGHSYESDGALWLRTTTFGDDKDRVLRRSNGAPTYFAADLAYLLEKQERGVDLQLLPVGSDHHGYVARMKAAFQALGGDPEALELPILQFVHLIEGDERAAMSKRRGDFITLDELLDEIGVDATRFFMLQRSHDRTVDLDLDLARRESPENPVYYIQYAHARIVSMLGRLEAERVSGALGPGSGWGEGELADAERDLIQALVAFPDEIAEAAERRAPHRIAAYALELAQTFTAFYRDCKVVGVEPESVESFRVALSQASSPGDRPGAVAARGERAGLDVVRALRGILAPPPRARASELALEVLVEPARVGGAERRPGRMRRGGRERRGLAGAPAPPWERHRHRGDSQDDGDRRDHVDEQVEAVGRGLGQHGRPVLLYEVVLDLRAALALVDEAPDVVALLEGLGRLGHGQRLMADDAHHVALDLGERGAAPRVGGQRGGGGDQQSRQEAGQHPGERASHDLSRIGVSVWCSHLVVTGKRCRAWMRPCRLITNVSGTPVVPNARTKSPLTSRSTG